jgi:endonuclease-3
MKLFPREKWIQLAHLLIHHGRAVCQAQRPKCASCPIEDLCYSEDKTVGVPAKPRAARAARKQTA